jgi:hypothetical protein
MLQHHRLCSTAPEATVPLSEWTPIYRLRTNTGTFWKMDIFTSDDMRDTAFRADPPYRTRPLDSFNPTVVEPVITLWTANHVVINVR